MTDRAGYPTRKPLPLLRKSGYLAGFLGVAVTPVFSRDLGRHLLGELRELLGLRGHRLEDFPYLAELWADPIVTRFIGGVPLNAQDAWIRMLR